MATIDNFMNALAGFGAGIQGNGQEFLRNQALRQLGEQYQQGQINQDQYLGSLAAYDPLIARQRAGVGLPAPVILANEFNKARQSGDVQRMNDLAQFAKIYDKGVQVGGAEQAPPTSMASPAPNTPPANTSLGDTDLPQDFLTAMTQPAAAAPYSAGSAQASEGFSPMPGYAGSVAQIEATKEGAKERAKLEQQKDIKPEIEKEVLNAKDIANEAIALRDMTSRMPQLESTTKRLKALGEIATYTGTGRALDVAIKELGYQPRDQATARSEYISMVDNEVLPLLRETFGAQFTEKEGERLAKTLGDPNAQPEVKNARLRSFIRTKMESANTSARKLGLDEPFAPDYIEQFQQELGGGNQQSPSINGWSIRPR